MGALGYLAIVWHLIALVMNRHAVQFFDRVQLAGVPISGLTFGLLIWSPSLPVKAGVALWMIFSGFIEAWFFLGHSRPEEAEKVGTQISSSAEY